MATLISLGRADFDNPFAAAPPRPKPKRMPVARYADDQPRVPAGEHGGGQFAGKSLSEAIDSYQQKYTGMDLTTGLAPDKIALLHSLNVPDHIPSVGEGFAKADPERGKRALALLDELQTKFGADVSVIDLRNMAGWGGDAVRTGAMTVAGSHIYLNQNYFGENPQPWPGGRTSWLADNTLDGVITHEYGHVLDDSLTRDDRMPSRVRSAFAEWRAEYLSPPPNSMGRPSMYAWHGNPGSSDEDRDKEAVAEAFTAAYGKHSTERDSPSAIALRKVLDGADMQPSSRSALPGMVFRYSPDQPRGDDGKWISAGVVAGSVDGGFEALAQKAIDSDKGNPAVLEQGLWTSIERQTNRVQALFPDAEVVAEHPLYDAETGYQVISDGEDAKLAIGWSRAAKDSADGFERAIAAFPEAAPEVSWVLFEAYDANRMSEAERANALNVLGTTTAIDVVKPDGTVGPTSEIKMNLSWHEGLGDNETTGWFAPGCGSYAAAASHEVGHVVATQYGNDRIAAWIADLPPGNKPSKYADQDPQEHWAELFTSRLYTPPDQQVPVLRDGTFDRFVASLRAQLPPPSRQVRYAEDQTRDDHGRFADEGKGAARADGPVSVVKTGILDRFMQDRTFQHDANNPGSYASGTLDKGDVVLSAIAKERGADGPPKVVDASGMDALIKSGWTEMWRGEVNAVNADQMREGTVRFGTGVHGNGIYAAETTMRYDMNVAAQAVEEYARPPDFTNYSAPTELLAAIQEHDKGPGAVMRMSLDPSAKVIEWDEAERRAGEDRRYLPPEAKYSRDRDETGISPREDAMVAWSKLMADPGRWAMANGYDAIKVPNQGTWDMTHWVVLNRTKLAIQRDDKIIGGPSRSVPTVAKRYREDQTRDDHGRFASEGGPGAEALPKGGAALRAQARSGDADRLKKLAADRGMTPKEYRAAAQSHIASLMDQAHVRVRVPYEVVQKVLDEGRFMSQHEAGESGGNFDPEYRRDAEHTMFGYPKGVSEGEDVFDPRKRPIYGYLMDDSPDDGVVNQYGDVIVWLKDDVKDRTTWTGNDSLNLQAAPSPMRAPLLESVDGIVGYGHTDPLDWATVKDIQYPGSYVEAQIHGGLRVSDIAAIEFTPHAVAEWSMLLGDDKDDPANYRPEVVRDRDYLYGNLEAAGIPWRVGGQVRYDYAGANLPEIKASEWIGKPPPEDKNA